MGPPSGATGASSTTTPVPSVQSSTHTASPTGTLARSAYILGLSNARLKMHQTVIATMRKILTGSTISPADSVNFFETTTLSSHARKAVFKEALRCGTGLQRGFSDPVGAHMLLCLQAAAKKDEGCNLEDEQEFSDICTVADDLLTTTSDTWRFLGSDLARLPPEQRDQRLLNVLPALIHSQNRVDIAVLLDRLGLVPEAALVCLLLNDSQYRMATSVVTEAHLLVSSTDPAQLLSKKSFAALATVIDGSLCLDKYKSLLKLGGSPEDIAVIYGLLLTSFTRDADLVGLAELRAVSRAAVRFVSNTARFTKEERKTQPVKGGAAIYGYQGALPHIITTI